MSFHQLHYHVVFSTKFRLPAIIEEYERDIYKLIFKLFVAKGGFVRRIGGMPDHVHILVDLPAKDSVSDILKFVKANSSQTIKNDRLLPSWAGWQEGYGAFTVSYELIEQKKNYIINQKEHHCKVTFLEEYRQMLIDEGISPDEPFFPK